MYSYNLQPFRNIGRHWIVLFWGLSNVINIFSQELPPGFRVEPFPLSPIETASQVANCISQDSTGFIWFGTFWEGVKKYNGNELKNYFHTPADSTSISDNRINDIYVTRNHEIWLATPSGLCRYNPLIDGFDRFYPDSVDENSLSNGNILHLIEDYNGNLWIGHSEGIDRYNPLTEEFQRFPGLLKEKNPLQAEGVSVLRTWVSEMIIDKAGVLWVGFVQELSNQTQISILGYFDEENDTFTHYWLDSDNPYGHNGEQISAMLEDSHGNFWIGGVDNKLYLFDKQTGNFSSEGILPSYKPEIANIRRLKTTNYINFVFEDRDGKLWIEDEYPGIRYYDPETQQSINIDVDAGGDRFPDISELLQSTDGTIWALAHDKVVKVIPPRQLFDVYPIDLSAIPQNITFNRIYTVFGFENSKGELWASTNYGLENTNHGLMWVSADKRNVKHYPPEEKGLRKGYIGGIWEDKNHKIWVVSAQNPYRKTDDENHKIYRFDPLSEQFEEIIGGPLAGIWGITEDSEGNIWFATLGEGLYKLNIHTGTFSNYRPDINSESGVNYNYMTAIYQDENGIIWIGGGRPRRVVPKAFPDISPSFFGRFDANTETFEIYELPQPKSFDVFSFPQRAFGVHSIGKNPKNEIWASTYQGIFRFNEELEKIVDSRPATDLGLNLIDAMAMDKEGDIWLVALNTINLFSKDWEKILTFNSSHGLNILPHFLSWFPGNSRLGNFFIGDYLEYYQFSPSMLKQKLAQKPSKINITEFYLENDLVNIGENSVLSLPIWKTNALSLSYDQNVFGFRFSNIDFENPEENSYLFKLDNYDEEWRDAGKEQQASYVKVPPGNYTFRVKGQNSFGQWSEERTADIHISPPWWATKLAYFFYIVFALGILFLAFYIQRRRLLVRNELLLEKERRLALESIDQARTRLYTNISHEFRTPLSVISALSEQIVEQLPGNLRITLSQPFEAIQRNSHQLLRLVNQLLDLAKLEAQALKPRMIQSDVMVYLKYLVESFHSFAVSKGIELSMDTSLPSLDMDYDPDRFRDIVSNLISNALKFTEAGGKVNVQFSVVSNQFAVDSKREKNSNTSRQLSTVYY